MNLGLMKIGLGSASEEYRDPEIEDPELDSGHGSG
jgi:hypothetical protein